MSAFAEPATATKTTIVKLTSGEELTVNGQFSSILRYSRQAAGKFTDGEGNPKPGENEPFAVFEIAGTDPAVRKAVHCSQIAEIAEVK
jgi:hypothetical protein